MLSYYRPKTITECFENISENREYIAGGTDLMVEVKGGHSLKDKILIDLSQIEELKGISMIDNKLVIKACATHDDVVLSEDVKKALPALSQACRTVGSPQIRNIGTVGGSVGTASPASDPIPPMLLGNCLINIAGKNGDRQIKLEDFIKGPGKTDLNYDELIHSFELDDLSEYKMAFYKIGRRKALAIARLNFCIAIKKLPSNKIDDIRIVVGAALPVSSRFYEMEEKLKGQELTDEITNDVGAEIAGKIVEVTGRRKSTEYKLPVIEKVVKRIIKDLEV